MAGGAPSSTGTSCLHCPSGSAPCLPCSVLPASHPHVYLPHGVAIERPQTPTKKKLQDRRFMPRL